MTSSPLTSIITGSARGIGLEIAKGLYDLGHNLVLNDVDDQELEVCIHNRFAGDFSRIAIVPGNIMSLEVIQSLIPTSYDRFGQLNYVVANAGVTSFNSFIQCTEDQYDQVMDTNLKATFFLVQAAVKSFGNYQIDSEKAILVMSSVTGFQAHGQLTAYAMSKAALAMMAKNLVAELSPLGIRINAIAPGATLTERTSNEAYIETWSRLTPLGRPAHTRQIADAAIFLLSEKASHITGQTLIIDGGWTSMSPQPPMEIS